MGDIEVRLKKIEHRYARMMRTFWAFLAVFLVSISALTLRPAMAIPAENRPDILRVKGLVIVDEDGTERVWIGAPLPGRLVNGKREQRPSRQAGIVLYDNKGIERSGYVTDDKSSNVFLSPDDRERQEAVFVASAERGTSLRLWYGHDSAEMRVDPDDPGGSPRISLVRAGKTIYEQGSAGQSSK